MRQPPQDDKIVAHKGLPPKRTHYGVIQVFGVLAVLAAVIILVFQSTLFEIDRAVGGGRGTLSLALSGLAIATLVASVQAWILRYHINPSNLWRFIGAAAAGGLVGGIVSGVLGGAGVISGGLATGGLIGMIAGAVSSAGQNQFMRSKDMKQRWMLYAVISWMIIWAIGWTVGWSINAIAGTATAVAIIVGASGLALWLFFQNTTIEF